MPLVVLVASLLFGLFDQLIAVQHATHHNGAHVTAHHGKPTTTANPLLTDIDHLKESVESITRQVMTQNLFIEERIRSDGDSGYKIPRRHKYGTKAYMSGCWDSLFADIPHHARHLVLQESNFVMNGVDFKVGWSRYSLNRPSTNTKTFHRVEDIPFPDVPPSVLAKHNITQQIEEMAQYFKAFKFQNTHIRSDYKKYFKPVLCYIEGAWLDKDPVWHDGWRHSSEHTSFVDNSGIASFYGTPTYDPVKIIDVVNGTAYYAHWNHRILCHPIKTDVVLNDMIIVDDLSSRLGQMHSLYDYSKSKAARFRVATYNGYNFMADAGYSHEKRMNTGHTKLDKIMEEIPGKDNYPANLMDDSFDLVKYRGDMVNLTLLNTGYYHRWYKVNKKGAMGTTRNYRGYADENLWTAKTSQPRVVKMSVSDCVNNRTVHHKVCTDYVSKYTYALPLEIVWLTPLLKWNPYDFHVYHGDVKKAPANIVTSHGRKGGRNATLAFNGVNDENYYLTPAEFFDEHFHEKGVLDKHNKVRIVSPSGTQTILPSIKSVGKVRLRYPIMPYHHEGNAVYKQLDALKEIVMNMAQNAHIFEKSPKYLYVSGEDTNHAAYQEHFRMSRSTVQSPPSHIHDVYINWDQHQSLHNHTLVTAYTSISEGHSHLIEFHIRPHHENQFEMVKCDGATECFDKHYKAMYRSNH